MANLLSQLLNPEGSTNQNALAYQQSELLPYLDQRPSYPQQTIDYWLPQLREVLGPGLKETLAGGYTPPTAEQIWENPLYNALNPENLSVLGMLIGPKSALWKKLPRVAEDVPQGAFSSLYDKTPMVEVADTAKLKPESFTTMNVNEWLEQRAGKKDIYHPELRSEWYNVGGKKATLKDVLQDADYLFEIDPSLASTKVDIKIGRNLASGGAAIQNARGKITKIRAQGTTPDEAMQVVLHEIQHKIGEQNKWPTGGDLPRGNISLVDLLKDPHNQENINSVLKPYENLLGEIIARDTASRNALSLEQRTVNPQLHPLAGQGGLDPGARWGPMSTENIPLLDAIIRNR